MLFSSVICFDVLLWLSTSHLIYKQRSLGILMCLLGECGSRLASELMIIIIIIIVLIIVVLENCEFGIEQKVDIFCTNS